MGHAHCASADVRLLSLTPATSLAIEPIPIGVFAAIPSGLLTGNLLVPLHGALRSCGCMSRGCPAACVQCHHPTSLYTAASMSAMSGSDAPQHTIISVLCIADGGGEVHCDSSAVSIQETTANHTSGTVLKTASRSISHTGKKGAVKPARHIYPSCPHAHQHASSYAYQGQSAPHPVKIWPTLVSSACGLLHPSRLLGDN